MIKFTKGPWILYKSGIEGAWIDPIGLRVDVTGQINWEANARLISAAPEMYQLLKMLANYKIGFINVAIKDLINKVEQNNE